MSIRLCDLVIAQEKSKIKAGEGKTKGDYKFFTSSNIQTKYVDFFQYDKPALIFGTGGVPSIHYCDEPFSTSTDCLVLCAKNTMYSLKSLYLFFESHMNLLEKGFHGAGLQHISKKYILDIQIPDIPINQQSKINDIGDQLNKLINIRKQQLEFFDMVVKSRFIEMFGDCVVNPKGWKTKPLEDIAEVGSSKRVFIEELQKSGIPFYRGTEVGALAEGKQINPELFITEEHYAELCKATGAPQIGDLLMPSICPDGRIWVINTDKPFYFKDGRVLWVHAIDNSYNPVFLLYTLKNRIMTDYSSIASGTTFAELKIFALKKCQIYDVPTALQNKFADYAKQTDKSKFECSISLNSIQSFNFYNHFQI